MKSNPNSALEYIRACISAFNSLRNIAISRNKTLKIKACIDTCDILTQRLKATEQTLVCGANDTGLKANSSIEVQRAIYDSILIYWSEILGE